ncbi:MAG TPA: DUF4349 domain-containing protein [Chloroflexota bacterium]|nr:DUF4349 domain-containing protein [Chloroflexota bacterium]
MRLLNRVTRPLALAGAASLVLILLVAGLPRAGTALRRQTAVLGTGSTIAPEGPAGGLAKQDQREQPGAPTGSASRAAAPAPSGAPAGQTAPASFGVLPPLDRMVVKTGALTVQLGGGTAAPDGLSAAMQRVNAVVAGIPGAYVAASSTSYRGEPPGASGVPGAPDPAIAKPEPLPAPRPFPSPSGLTATLTLKVPVDSFDQAMARLRELGAPLAEQISTQEVTEEYVDLEAQVRTLEATEQQYLRLLERAQRIEEILPIQQRLNEVRTQIERLRGRMALLQRRSDVSTITLTLVVPAGKDATGPGGEPRVVRTLRAAWGQMAVVLLGALDVLIYAGIYALPLAPLPLAYIWWRRRQARPATAGGAV